MTFHFLGFFFKLSVKQMTEPTYSIGGLKQRHFAKYNRYQLEPLYDKEEKAIIHLLSCFTLKC